VVGNDLLVHYSIVLQHPHRVGQLMRQLAISLTTLRVRNPAVPVVIFCHGEVPEHLQQLAATYGATICEQPTYVERLTSLLGPLGNALADYLPLQKFLNLEQLAAMGHPHVLYLDCDTVILGDLRELVRNGGTPTVVAREEVGSGRCIHGADPDYLDESRLGIIAHAAAGFVPAPACNTGVVLFNNFPFDRAHDIELSFARWALRFALWMAANPAARERPQDADVVDIDLLRTHLDGPDGRHLFDLAIEYPSTNRWILEEVAFWMALGEQRDVSHGQFDPALVAQGAEPLDRALPTHIWHYFSSNQGGMASRLGLPGNNHAPSGA